MKRYAMGLTPTSLTNNESDVATTDTPHRIGTTRKVNIANKLILYIRKAACLLGMQLMLILGIYC